MHEPRWINTQMFYSRSPTNNILTSLRILSGDGRLGGGVFVKHLCPALWMKGTANPGTYTPAGLARPFYLRIGATWCNTSATWRVRKKTKMDKCLRDTSVFFFLSSSTCHSQETLQRRCFCFVAYKLDLRRAHALRRQQACWQPRPLGSADGAKIVYFHTFQS